MENKRNNKKTAIIIILFLIGVAGLVALMIGLLTKMSSNNKPNNPVVETIEVEDNQTTIYNGEENAPTITSKLSDTDVVTYEYSLKTSDSYDNLDFNEGLPSNAGSYWIKIYLNSIEKKVVTYTIEKANPVAEIVKVKYVQNNYFTTDYLVSDLTFDSEFYFNSEIVEGTVKLDEEELKPSISTYHYTFTPNNDNFNNVKGEVDILVYASVYLYKGDELYDVLEVPYNSLFEVDPFEARDGYSVPYWVDNAGNTYDENTLITDDVSLVFTEDLIEYNVIYNLDGGSNDSRNPQKFTILDDIELLAPSKIGYNFEGWYLDKEFEIIIYSISNKFENIELYAKFTIIEYSITYVLDGGTNDSNNPTKITIEDKIQLMDPTKYGYNFEGWYLNNELVEELSTVSTNIELYAKFSIGTYTISFNTVGGEQLDSITQEYNSELFLPTSVEKRGFTFVAWYYDEAYTKVVYNLFNMPGEDMTLYAKWNIVTYNIKYNLNDGDNDSSNPYTYNVLDTIELLDATKAGYTFTGWTLNGEAITTITNMIGDIELVANFAINQYTIQFEENDGELLDDITVDYNSLVELPTANRMGYEFSGWYKEATFENRVAMNYTVLDNITLYAKWTLVTYDITYVLNDGTNGSNPTTYTILDTIELEVATKTGYTFTGWTLNDEAITTISNMTGDLELVANFEINQYTIQFVENGGIEVENITADYDSAVTISSTTKTGYDFAGWYYDQDLLQPALITRMPLDGTTLYAKWNIVTYNITYTLNGGTNGVNPTEYTIEDTIELKAATKTGYTFGGWSLNNTPITEIKNMTGDIELVANFTINPYTVTFVENGGEELEPVTRDYNTTITLPETTRTGYTFGGWYSDEGLNNRVATSYTILEDVTLYAKWNIVTYEITYTLNGGANDSNNPATYTVEDTIVLAAATKLGYTFTGWTLNGEAITTISNMTGDIELVANFTINQYTITFEENGGAEVANITADFNSAVTLPETTKRGYTFGGWYTDSGLNTPATITKMPVDGATLYAKWNIVTYEITYVLNGGTNGNNPSTYTVEDTIQLAAAEKTGYTFVGWSLDGVAIDTISNSIGDLELVANYTPNTNTKYYVRHMIEKLDGSYELYIVETLEGTTDTLTNAVAKDINGFTATEFEQINIDGDQTSIVEIKYTRNTYKVTFVYESGLDNSPYAVNETIVEISIKYEAKITTIPVELAVSKYEYSLYDELYNLVTVDTTITGPLTVKVVYVLRELSIVFYNTVEAIPTMEGVLEGQTVTLPSTSKTGYTFDGWATEQNGSVVYQGNEEITMPSTPLDLYAVWTINQYTIQFEENGGVEVADITADYNSAVTLPETTKRGYTFGGWYTDSGLNTPSTITKMPVDGATLYAKWNIVTYNITYTLNGGSNTNPATYTVESNITLADSEKNGYTFTGWTLNGNSITEISDMIGDITLVANFEINNYEITYVLNGGTNSVNNPSTYTIEDTITLEDATKTGYTFGGWFLEEDFNTPISEILLGSTGNKTLYAKFTAISYTITYVLNGGTNGDNPVTYTIEDTIELANSEKTGYTFTGWTLNGNAITEISDMIGDITLVANFEINNYDVTYVLNGGTNGNNPSTYTVNDDIVFEAATKTGYTFGGWYTDSEFNDSITEISLGSTGNKTLYAKFTPVVYTITYVLDGGTNTNPTTYTIEDTIELANSEKTGYTFTGWTLNNQAITTISNRYGDITLTANFTINQYTIQFEENGGVEVADIIADYNSAVTLPETTKRGYTFGGWYTDSGLNTPATITKMPIDGAKLYAKWNIVTYNITYTLNGGTSANPTTYTVEDTIELAAATKTGYTFTGWTLDDEAITTISNMTGNITLVANYTIDTYTITYVLNGGTNNSNNPASYNVTDSIVLADATKNGYTFNGWYTDSGFNNSVSEIAVGTTGNKTFYAKFTAISYTITYVLDGGINGANPATYTIEDTITLVDATKEGYSFVGWYTESSFTNQVSSIPSGTTGNKTFYAKFEFIDNSNTITYVLNGGTNSANNPAYFTPEMGVITLENPTKGNAYTFGGWYLDSSFTNRIIVIDCENTDENLTLYAKWNAVKYTIIYYDGSEVITTLTPTSYTADDTVTLPTYNKFNHTFGGWYTEAALTNRITSIPAGTTGTIKLYAKTTDKGFTVKFYDVDGTALLDTKTTTTYGSVTAPSYSYDSNTYHFTWVNKTNGEEVDLTSIDANYNLKAQLVLISYTATIYYTDADGYATTARSNAILASVENTNLTFGDTVNLTRQMRITNASTYDFFYMSPVAAFDWSYAVAAVAKAAAYTNADGTISCIVETDGTNGTLIIIVYCIQPVAIITSSSQTLAYSENTNMSTSTYQFYKTIDEAFDVYSTSSGKLLRIYGRQGSALKANCLTPHKDTTIAAKSTTLGTYTITRPKLVYNTSDYVLHNSYTISSNILLPYYRSCTDTTGYVLKNNSTALSSSHIHSIFVIDTNVTLTLNATLIVGAEIQGGGASTVVGHGVIINNGEIITEPGASVVSYGYIKGTGTLVVESGAKLIDYFKIYDWPGGRNAAGLYNNGNVFPITSYSFHNVSCKAKIYSGATYTVWSQVYASGWAAEYITLVGSGGLFQLSSGYIEKSIQETTKVINTNTLYTSSNIDITVKDVIDIHGNFTDNIVSMTLYVSVSTGVDLPMPIGFMSIKISEGNGVLSKNSYKFLPGSSLEVEAGAKLTISTGVKVAIYDEYPDDYTYKNGDTTQSGATNPYSYQNRHSVIYTNGLVNDGYHPEFIINGILDCKGYIGGKILTTSSFGSIILSNASVTVKKVTSLTYGGLTSSCSTTNETINAQIYLLSNNSFAWSNAEKTTYSAVSYNGEYGWTKNTNVTSYVVTYNINGQTSQTTINTTGSSYTFVESDLPTVDLDGYVFDGWYTTNSYTTEALGYTITANQTLYAKLTPIIYSIEYEIAILDDYDETQPMINNNVTYFTFSDTVTFTSPTCGDLNFTGWFVDNKYSVNAPNITSSTLQYYKYLIDETNTIHLYGYFSSIAYYTVVYRNSEGIEIESIPSERIRAGESITIAAAMPSYQDTESIDTTLYAYKMINFSKWYVIDSGAHIVAQLNPGDTYTPTSSVNIVPYYTDGSTYVSITPGSLSNASYTVSYSGGSGSSNATFYVPKGTQLTFNVSYTESDSRKFTYTPASGSASSNTTQTANYNATVSASSEAGSCVARGTLVTLADGSQKKVEDLKVTDSIVVFNHNTGKFETGSIGAIVNHGYSQYDIMLLTFDDGTQLKLIGDHGLFDIDLLEYVSFRSDTLLDYIGHRFIKYDSMNNSVSSVVLVDAHIETEYTESWSVFSAIHLNHVINSMLGISTGLPGFFNFYDYDSEFKYDNESMSHDILEYGQYTYDDWKDYITYEVYAAFNFENVKANVEKGNSSKEVIIEFINWFYELMDEDSMWINN